MRKIIALAFLVFLFASLSHVAEAKPIICDEWKKIDPSKARIEHRLGKREYTPALKFARKRAKSPFLARRVAMQKTMKFIIV